jgi:hypothetical protein
MLIGESIPSMAFLFVVINPEYLRRHAEPNRDGQESASLAEVPQVSLSLARPHHDIQLHLDAPRALSHSRMTCSYLRTTGSRRPVKQTALQATLTCHLGRTLTGSFVTRPHDGWANGEQPTPAHLPPDSSFTR